MIVLSKNSKTDNIIKNHLIGKEKLKNAESKLYANYNVKEMIIGLWEYLGKNK